MKKHEQGRQCDSPERNAEILDCEGKVDKIPEKEFERMIARVPKNRINYKNDGNPCMA